jgi:hypothetical protein
MHAAGLFQKQTGTGKNFYHDIAEGSVIAIQLQQI